MSYYKDTVSWLIVLLFAPPQSHYHLEKSYCGEFLKSLSSVTLFICRKKTQLNPLSYWKVRLHRMSSLTKRIGACTSWCDLSPSFPLSTCSLSLAVKHTTVWEMLCALLRLTTEEGSSSEEKCVTAENVWPSLLTCCCEKVELKCYEQSGWTWRIFRF